MLLICPECRTRYVVPDSAIGANGRQVRCANCRHSWFQSGIESPPAPPAPSIVAPPTAAEPAQDDAVSNETDESPSVAPSVAAAAEPMQEDVPAEADAAPGFASFADEPAVTAKEAPELPQRFTTPAPAPVHEPVVYADPEPVETRSQFAREPLFRPRRNPAKLWTYAAIAFAILVTGLGAATWYFGWLDNSFGSSIGEPDLKIVLHDNLELGRDADGSPYFIASGSIVNPTAQTQRVPELLVTLKDASGRPVYSWTMKAPVRTLAPGAKADFSQLRRDVPLAASRISVGWALGG